MLQTIHGGAKKWIIVPLLVLLVLSFVAWGIADVFQGRVTNETVVTVGRVEYTGQQLQQEVQRGMEYLRQMTGGAISSDQAMRFGFVQRTLDNMIERALLQQEANRIGIVVSDDVIMKAIRALPEFQRPDGGFDAAAFRNALGRVAASEQVFVNDQRQTLARTQIKDMVTSGVESPDTLNRVLAAAAAEERDFDLFRVKFADQKAPATPDDSALAAFMQENAALFSAPEFRSISVIRLSAEDVAKDLTVTDEQIEEYYTTHKSEFERPEQRSYNQVVADSHEQAVKVIGAFNLTRDLAAAAKSVGVTATPLNDVSQNDLPDELRDEAFALSSGAVSQAIQSDIGWHVLQQTGQRPASVKSLDAARADIRTNLLQQAAQERLYQAGGELDDLIAAGTSLEEIAEQLRVSVRKAEAIDAKGEGLDGNTLGPILGQREMLAEAFKTEQGAQSDVVTTPAGDFFVVRVDSITPSAVKPLNEVRREVIAAWTSAEQERLAMEKATAVMAEVKKGATLQSIASQFGIESSFEKNLSRDAAKLPKYIPGPMLRDLYSIKLGDVTQFPGEDAIIIARLAAVHHPVSVDNADVAGSFARQASESLQNELYDAYTSALKQRYKVEINQSAIDRLFKSGDEG